MSKQFASAGDMAEKRISFTEIGPGLWAFTAEGDPNTGIIIGRDAAMVFQEPSTALNPVYTVGWQIAEGLRAAGLPARRTGLAHVLTEMRWHPFVTAALVAGIALLAWPLRRAVRRRAARTSSRATVSRFRSSCSARVSASARGPSDAAAASHPSSIRCVSARPASVRTTPAPCHITACRAARVNGIRES